ncbi:MAG: alpha/beta fold hydrolase [Bacillota bacterium]
MPYLGHTYYEVQGEGPALLLLHGHTLDHRMWWEHVGPLAARYRVITPDLDKHGRSGPSPDGTPLCQTLAALLDHLGVGSAAVCGLSAGGAAAISFALNRPERCAALIPVDTAIYGHPFRFWTGAMPYIKQAQTEGLAPALEAWVRDPIFQRAAALPAMERLAAIVREYPGTDWLARPAYSPYPRGDRTEAERLGEITAPTLVMVGEHDLPDFQIMADLVASSVRGARKLVIAGAGHLSPIEQAEAFRQALLAFLEEALRPYPEQTGGA